MQLYMSLNNLKRRWNRILL